MNGQIGVAFSLSKTNENSNPRYGVKLEDISSEKLMRVKNENLLFVKKFNLGDKVTVRKIDDKSKRVEIGEIVLVVQANENFRIKMLQTIRKSRKEMDELMSKASVNEMAMKQ